MNIKTALVGVLSALSFSLSPVVEAASPTDKYGIVVPDVVFDADVNEMITALCQNMLQQMGGLTQERIDKILSESRAGNIKAQGAAGILYITGVGVKQDVRLGMSFIAEAARNGEENALMMMASLYISGIFGDQYIDKGIEIMKDSADKGNVMAMYTMAMMELSEGNYEECAYWYNRVISCNDPYFNKALQCLSASLLQTAQQGDSYAQTVLAVSYLLGVFGYEVNEQEAFKWCKKAAMQGHPEAILMLGVFYHEGVGTAPDRQKAIYFLNKAVEMGVEGAQEELDAVKREGATSSSTSAF